MRLKGLVNKEHPLLVRMHTRGRMIKNFEVTEVTEDGIKVKGPTDDVEQTYQIGGEHGYDPYLNPETKTLHVTVYEGKPTPPVNLVEGQWKDTDPEETSEWVTRRAKWSALASMLRSDEGRDKWLILAIVLLGMMALVVLIIERLPLGG